MITRSWKIGSATLKLIEAEKPLPEWPYTPVAFILTVEGYPPDFSKKTTRSVYLYPGFHPSAIRRELNAWLPEARALLADDTKWTPEALGFTPEEIAQYNR
jgi:hypothetical protein